MSFLRLWALLDTALKVAMALLLFAMMAITAIDVVGRYLLNAPVPGGYEIVQYLMAIVVFAALPLTTASDRHLSVSLVGDQLGGVPKCIHRVFVLTVSSLALVVIAWRMAEQAMILARSQQISGYLQLPLPPIAWTMSAMAALAALIVLVKLVTAIMGREVASPADAMAAPGAD
jgi:TRAP-type C4-dicarboxylate transport system permease small subunit